MLYVNRTVTVSISHMASLAALGTHYSLFYLLMNYVLKINITLLLLNKRQEVKDRQKAKTTDPRTNKQVRCVLRWKLPLPCWKLYW